MPTNTMLSVQEQERTEALERLMALLESGAPEFRLQTSLAMAGDGDYLSRLARLRSAHATYVLTNNIRMTRIAPGAFVARGQ